jgi:N-acetyl-gamma-glutamyl-phosphate/LysW-gamma-L-alpha-aminoadipyl-6-phosphate reductase
MSQKRLPLLAQTRVKAVVAGASGYIGGEALRLLLSHPNVELAAVTGHESAGRAVSDEHPGFRGLLDMRISRLEEVDWKGIDFALLSLPSGEAMKAVGKIPAGVRIVDTTPDFRLRDQAAYEKFYKAKHTAWERQKEFVYGLPELFRAKVKEARHVAAPGCFATASILGVFPLLASGLSRGPFYVSAVTGSSGSGAHPKEITHHPFRADSLFAYGPFTHRHIPEVEQALSDATGRPARVVLQPHSGPYVRGILATVFAKLDRPGDVRAEFEKAYAGEPFVRLRAESPNVKWVRETNFADIAAYSDGEHATIVVAIDNLAKGGAGQAVQCLNLMFGLDEAAGLRLAGANP